MESFAERPGRAALPFLAAAVAGLASLLVPPYKYLSYDWWAAGLGAGLTALLVALVAVLPRDHWAAGVPPLAFFGVVAVARDASGGAASGLTPLVLLPVLWIVLYGTAVQLRLAAVCTAVVFLLPVIVVGAPEYDPADWRRALVWVTAIVVICPILQRGVFALRRSVVSERVRAGQFESVLRAATEHSIIATDLTGRISLFSPGAEKMLGYQAADLVDRVDPSVIHDPVEVADRAAQLGIPPGFNVFVNDIPAGGFSVRRWTYRRRDGGTLRVSLTITAMLDAAGTQLGWIGVARDVTAEEIAQKELEAAEARWRVMLEHLPDITVLVVDDELRYRVASGAGLRRQGWSELVGRSVDETSNAVNRAALTPVYRSALAGADAQTEVRSTVTGVTTHVVAVPLPPDAHGRPEALVLARDVTEDRRRETEIVEARDEARNLFVEAPHGALLISPEGHIVQVNPALEALLSCPAGDLLDRSFTDGPLQELFEPGQLDALLAGHTTRFAATRALTSTAQPTTVEVAAVRLAGPPGLPRPILLSVVDVSERKRFEQQLAHLADHDPLTGLANRRKFDAELAAHLDRCRRYGPQGALLMMDLDNFKQINDTLGHGAGDQLIISVASVLKHRLRTSDVVARLGGDEFAVLLPVADRAATAAVAQDLVELIRNTVCVLDGTRPRTVTSSIGAVLIQDIDVTASELVSTADMTMYDAKEAGRDQYVLHDLTEYAIPRTGARMAWTSRIADALAGDGFRVHAQPILDIATNTITGAELLIRMVDNDGQLIPPGRFLYIAERTSLITDIDAFMLDQAGAVLAQVNATHPDFSINVNLSGRSVGNPRITQLIPQIIDRHHINPANLVLEITETAAVANIEIARTFAAHMRDLGCRFALDDFGAGFGSFYYLKHLVFDYVKIDGELVSQSATNPADQLIIASIVDIARGMNKTTVAEFVADPHILDTITSLGVDRAQGYHIGRPTPVDQLIATLTQPAPTTSDPGHW